MAKRNIVIIGASAGGLSPLQAILARIPARIDASLFVAQHIPSRPTSYLPKVLSQAGPLPAEWAKDRQPIRPGAIYVAPADRHLILNRNEIRVLFGPRECLSRPSIDVLFRSAAVAYGSQVVGIILSGRLDDGARGLHAIKRCGGTSIVMVPELADEPEMPKAALREAGANHVLSPDSIGLLISQLAEETVEPVQAPQDIRWENQ